jgi:hypothetical protein
LDKKIENAKRALLQMADKIKLTGYNGVIYPHMASISLYVTEYGIESTVVLRFKTKAGSLWHLNLPVNINTNVQRMALTGAQSIGRTHYETPNELTVLDIVSDKTNSGLTVIVILVQPMSIRHLLFEWLRLGTEVYPCLVTLDFNLLELPMTMRKYLEVYIKCEDKKLSRSISLTDITTLILDKNINCKLCITVNRRSRKRGFGFVQKLAAKNDMGKFVIVTPQVDCKEPYSSAITAFSVSVCDGSADARVVLNTRMMLGVIDKMLKKSTVGLEPVCITKFTPKDMLVDMANQIVRISIWPEEWALHALVQYASWSSWRTSYELPCVVENCLRMLPL